MLYSGDDLFKLLVLPHAARALDARSYYFLICCFFTFMRMFSEVAYFEGKISKNGLVCKNAVALAYYASAGFE